MLHPHLRCIANAATAIALLCFGNAAMAADDWTVASIPFKIKGEKDVNNVKLAWDRISEADSYRVCRDGLPVAEIYSVVYDDYGLPADSEHSYYVEALNSGKVIKRSTPSIAKTYRNTHETALYDNLDGKYIRGTTNGPSAFKIGKTYYSYAIERIERNVDNCKVTGWSVTEKKSHDGKTKWSKPREMAFYPEVNMEGNAFNYNPVTGKVVLSSHLEDAGGYDAAKIFLAQITPGKCIETVTAERPLGHDSRDYSLFIDTDNTAYLLSATNMNRDINIYRLDKSWTKPEELVNTICKGAHRETPYIVKTDGEYYFFSSKASGWYPSQTMYCSASDIAGEWSELKETGNNTTFDSQFNNIKKLNDTPVSWSYHWGAQREYKTDAGNFPRINVLAFNNGTAFMPYFRYVEFDSKHGAVPVQNGRILSLSRHATASGGAEEAKAQWINDGLMFESSDFFKKDEGDCCEHSYTLTVDLGSNANLSEINLATRLVNGSECAYSYTIEGSADNENYDMLVDGRKNRSVGFLIHDIASATPYRYLRLQVYDLTNVHNGNSGQWWADGVYELTAYGTPLK